MDMCINWWVVGWVGSSQISENRINFDLIRIIQFMIYGDSPTYGLVGRWGQVMSNH